MTRLYDLDDLQWLWELLADLAARDGVAPLATREGCWIRRVGEWQFAVNGHRVEIAAKFGEEPAVPVPPFHLYAERSGWPAIVASPAEGACLSPAAIGDLAAAIERELGRSDGGSAKSSFGATEMAPDARS